MSHGSSGSDKCEPNLIPLLDLVLQLVMFFMVCANFVMEQVNETIKLPDAVSARPVGAKEDNIIFLNVNKEGHVLLSAMDAPSDDPADAVLTNPARVQTYMKRRYDEDTRRKPKAGEAKPAPSLLIVRADKECPFEKVYAVMKSCRQAGYERAQLRAIRFGGKLD